MPDETLALENADGALEAHEADSAAAPTPTTVRDFLDKLNGPKVKRVRGRRAALARALRARRARSA